MEIFCDNVVAAAAAAVVFFFFFFSFLHFLLSLEQQHFPLQRRKSVNVNDYCISRALFAL